MAASTTVLAAFSAANTAASPLFSLFQTFKTHAIKITTNSEAENE
jgi:hypothetical protein